VKIVVVGGVAGGMSFAARARRLSEGAEIVVLERGPHVSFANCGLPYHLAGEIPDRSSLLLHTPDSLSESLALDVRTEHEVQAIDRQARTVRVRNLHANTEYDEPYDTLVLSTGAAPLVPPLPGADLPTVKVLRSVPDVEALCALVDAGARSALVVGAGFIGLETAEAFARRGLQVAVVEMADQVLAPLDPEMARSVQAELERHGVGVRLSVSLTAIHAGGAGAGGGTGGGNGASAVVAELSDGTRLPADVVLLAVGVRPESALAQGAGLETTPRGGVIVDDHLRTSDPAIYAVGDAIQVTDAVTGQPAMVPLAGPANRQGRAAADHLFGRPGRRSPVLGTAIVRVFDVVAATTGRSEKALRAAGIDHRTVHLHPQNHAGYFPGAVPLHLKVVFSPEGRVLGAQATGSDGVDKRIDVITTAIHAGLTVQDLADLELAYAPPFGSAKDPVNMAGFIASNLLAGDLDLWTAQDLPDLPEDTVLIDVRSPEEFATGHLPGALNIPHTQLRDRLDEIPEGRPIRLYCASGFRSYLAHRVLYQRGYNSVSTLSGGLETLTLCAPDLPLTTT
jgi:NADPH-dependent 2,4-dienoyl-CoA reductase/sulfur reductase-like enzyme/rhodanese-related sulfurtransferase